MMHCKKNSLVLGLVGFTILAGFGAARVKPEARAATEAIDTVTLTVPLSCELSGTGWDTHAATIVNGAYTQDIGTTTMSVLCNDSSGFAVYAVGYSGGQYGETDMVASVGASNNIHTGTTSSGSPSAWAMKLTAGTGTDAPLIVGGFGSYSAVPSTYTKVVSRDSMTTSVAGSQFTTTYAVNVSATQAAGTYTGQVKYAVVHPASAAAPTPPRTYMQDVTNADLATLMPNDGDSVTLYDKRDESDYQITKINGVYWMTQNLRITDTVNAEYSNFSTNSPFAPCTGDLISGDSYDEARCHDSGNTTTGVWYNYAAASAGTITSSSNRTAASEDICPSGWHLPANGTAAGQIGSVTSYKDAFSPVTGGYYYNGSLNNTGYGYWWSATARNDAHRYNLVYYGSSLYTDYNNRNLGFYVRCTRTQ